MNKVCCKKKKQLKFSAHVELEGQNEQKVFKY